MHSIPVSYFKRFLAALLLLCGAVACDKKPSGEEDIPDIPEAGDAKAKLVLAFSENNALGVEEIRFIPYRENTLDEIISLPSITPSAGWFGENGAITYDDVSLPVGVSSALVYAKAIDKDAPITSLEDKFKFGILDVTGLGGGKPSLNDILFSPVPVQTGTSGKESQLIAILNAVANATPEAALSDGTRPRFKEVTEDQSAIISHLWDQFKKVPVASSSYVGWVLKDLYMNLDGLVTSAAQNTVPNGYKMALAIRGIIEHYCAVHTMSGITINCQLRDDYLGFPAEINLPDGAVGVAYNPSSGQFEVKPAADYVFPANRQYFADSPLRETQDAPPSGFADKPWDDILNAFSTGPVKSSSVAVAVEKPVRPAVAGLTVRVEGLDNTAKFYEFKNKEQHEQKEVDVTEGFQLISILVGGQKAVSWDFKPSGTKDYTTYGAVYGLTAATVKRGQPTEAYSLNLLPSDRTSVNFALEFINNCDDFVGDEGLVIPNGSVFYLPGTLKSSDGSPLLRSGIQMTASLTLLPATALSSALLAIPDLNAPQEYNTCFTTSL